MQTLKDKLSPRKRFSLAALKTKQLLLSPGAMMSLVLPNERSRPFQAEVLRAYTRLGQIRGLLFTPTTCQ